MPDTHRSAAHGTEAVFIPPTILNEGKQEGLSKACYRWWWWLWEDLPVDVSFSSFGKILLYPIMEYGPLYFYIQPVIYTKINAVSSAKVYFPR